MNKRLFHYFLYLTMLVTAMGLCAWNSGDWLTLVPSRESRKNNPYNGQADAISAGHRLYAEHCAQCHGKDAEGRGKKPPLRNPRVQQSATEGDLHWLLVNGDLRRGMPSWSKLPDQQRWQLVSYIKSLR